MYLAKTEDNELVSRFVLISKLIILTIGTPHLYFSNSQKHFQKNINVIVSMKVHFCLIF